MHLFENYYSLNILEFSYLNDFKNLLLAIAVSLGHLVCIFYTYVFYIFFMCILAALNNYTTSDNVQYRLLSM